MANQHSDAARRPRPVLLLSMSTAAFLSYCVLQARTELPAKSETEALLPATFMSLNSRAVVNTVATAFPGAMKGSAVMSRLLNAVKPYGLSRSNTIYGQSICSDEINSDPGHLPVLLTKYFGHNFHVGGIGGAPYVGKTGFAAFSHHVPDNGNVLVVFGPHIGFSPDGEAGKFLRTGQAALSTSCGAVIAAHSQLSSGGRMPNDPQDLMQSWLRQKLKPFMGAVDESDTPMINLVMKAYKVIEEEMLSIVNTDYGSGMLVLLGGIQINMPYPLPGYWLPLHFSVRSKTMEAKDLMGAFR